MEVRPIAGLNSRSSHIGLSRQQAQRNSNSATLLSGLGFWSKCPSPWTSKYIHPFPSCNTGRETACAWLGKGINIYKPSPPCILTLMPDYQWHLLATGRIERQGHWAKANYRNCFDWIQRCRLLAFSFGLLETIEHYLFVKLPRFSLPLFIRLPYYFSYKSAQNLKSNYRHYLLGAAAVIFMFVGESRSDQF